MTRTQPLAIGAFLAAVLLTAIGCTEPVQSPVPALEKIAQANNPEASYHLGMMYQTGTNVRIDHTKAFNLFKRAATLGDPLGAYKVGCYFAGQHKNIVAPDIDQALKYKLVAAQAGYALAQQDVAIIYAETGNGAAAARWAEASAAQGWGDGLATAASIFNVVPSGKRDPAKVAAYFRLFLMRTDPSQKQHDWLKEFEREMSKEDRERADSIVQDYRAAPTSLTLKALSGSRAAAALITNSVQR